MATECLAHALLEHNADALQICVSPVEKDIRLCSPWAMNEKIRRVKLCEDMVQQNCVNHSCLRVEMNDLDNTCAKIIQAIESKIQ